MVKLRSFSRIKRDNILLIVLNYDLRLWSIFIRKHALNYPLTRGDPDLRPLKMLTISINKAMVSEASITRLKSDPR